MRELGWVAAVAGTFVAVFHAGGCGSGSDSPMSLGLNADLGGYRPFPDDHAWNLDISGYPVHANSAAYISSMNGASGKVHPDFGTVYNGAPIGIPYFVVEGSQAKVPVSFTYADESDAGPYPIPLDTSLVEGGPNSTGDRHVIVIDRDGLKLYEMFNAKLNAAGTGWTADSGAVFDLATGADRPQGWTSADAAGLPILPGLARYDEVVTLGEIRHALRFTASQTQKAYIYPARHWASSSTDANRPPLGLRLRLKAGFDISGYSAPAQVVLKALKKYGMILADNGTNWMISGAPHEKWNDSALGDLKQVPGSAFEAVETGAIVKP